MILRNLASIVSGGGFSKKQGRKPQLEDLQILAGPLDIKIGSDGKIEKIGRHLVNDAQYPEFDGSGLMLTSSFIDSHTHALYAGQRAREYFMRWQGQSYTDIAKAGGGIINTFTAVSACDEDDLWNLLNNEYKNFLRHGTTVIEIKSGYGASPNDELRMLKAITRFKSSNPDCVSTFLGLHALPKDIKESDWLEQMFSLLKDVAHQKLADFVDAFPEVGFFSLISAKSFALQAQQFGLGLKIHADEITDMNASQTFIELGALSIDHLQKISPSAIAQLSRAETVATLLPATSFYLGLDYAPARKLLDSGARVALATDYNPGTAPSPSMPFTLLLAASHLKMTLAELWCAATYNGAAAIGKASVLGSIEVGKLFHGALWTARGKNSGASPEERLMEIIIAQEAPQFVFARNQRAFTKNN